MSTYLIVELVYRLDGITVAKGISALNQRRAVFRFRSESGTAILPGKTYSVSRLKGKLNFTLHTTSPAHWPLLVKRSFYLPDLLIPRREQARLLALTSQGVSAILRSLEKRDYQSLSLYISEPYASLLSYYYGRQTCLLNVANMLINSGLSHEEAMNICLIHSPEEALKLLNTPIKLLPFLNTNHLKQDDSIASTMATSLSYQLIAWMVAQANHGATIVSSSDVPPQLRSTLPDCVQNGYLVTDGNHYQLMGQHLIQSSIRARLQTLNHQFFPTYSNLEIDYAYVRYSSLYSARDDPDYCNQVVDAINSRFSIFTHSSNNSVSGFCDEFSSILQILGGSEPSVVHQGLVGRYGSETQIIHWESISEVQGEYRTFIVWDFQWYSAVELSLLLARFTPRDRILFLCNQATAIEDSLNCEIVSQLRNYFPSHSIEPARSSTPDKPSTLLPLDRAIDELQADPNLVAICDSNRLCELINELVRKRGKPTALETQWDKYSKGDRLLLKQAFPKTVTYARLVSTDDRGLVVETQGRYWRIDTEKVRDSICALGAAMTIDDALQAGVRHAVIVTAIATMSGFAQVIKEHGIDLIGAFTHDGTKIDTPNTSVSLQRITPSVE
ncbi:hypothetical protein K5F93_23595 [Pseudomonas protegens]|uniref:hypothetical protein n=1 Tax=Pseudomonas protegens TaxID=380021 RepID=UPI001C8D7E72|nr:hypothetical protein [Pseudomonas protegens]QZI69323.1 hypothetical protein K5F93_23595 [Pseudomonas protegens]